MEALDLIVPGLGTAVGIGSSIYGGIKAGQERKRMSNFISGQQSDNEAWYNKNYYGNYMDRTDTQALMKNLRDNLKTQSDRNAQTAVITGATPEAQLAAKEQANKAITDTTFKSSSNGSTSGKMACRTNTCNARTNYQVWNMAKWAPVLTAMRTLWVTALNR